MNKNIIYKYGRGPHNSSWLVAYDALAVDCNCWCSVGMGWEDSGRWPVAGEQVWNVTNETFQFSSDVSYYYGTRLERLNRTMITSEGNFVLIVL